MRESKLSLKNIVLYGFHGVEPAEHQLGQRIEVDVELYGLCCGDDFRDELSQTINYAEVYQLVKEIVIEAQFLLIESIARAISDQLMMKYNPLQVTVRVRKPQPPVGGIVETAEFEISNFRP